MANISSYVEPLTELMATTYHNVDTDIADLAKRNNPLYMKLQEMGQIRDFEGGSAIQEPVIVPTGVDTTNYRGYEPFPVEPQECISAAMYFPVQKVRTVTMSGRELLENRGPEAYIDMWHTKIELQTEMLMNSVNMEIAQSDGSVYESIGGLPYLISDNPQTSIVGSIDASLHEYWQNVAVGATEQLSEANIERYMDNVIEKLYIAGDTIDLIVADNSTYFMLKRALTSRERYVESKVGDMGFPKLQYQGVDVILNGGYQGTASDGVPIGGVKDQHMYFLNTRYIKLKVVKSGDNKNSSIRFGDVLQIPGQDAVSMSIYWMGQLTCNKRSAQGVLYQGIIA